MPTLIAPADIITRAWQTVAKNYRTYADFGLWFLFLGLCSWGLQMLTRELFPAQLLRSAMFSLLSIPVALAVATVTAGMIDATGKLVQGKKVSERESLANGLHHLVPFLWISILVGLTLVGGLVLLLVPFFVFFVWFRFSQNFVIIDDVRGTDAMRASKRLSSGRWWAVFGRIMFPGAFIYVLTMFVTAVLYMAAGGMLGDAGMFFGTGTSVLDAAPIHLFITTMIPQAVNAFLTLPLILAADVILWYDLKRSSGM
jgi:hypothetical protein